MTNQTPGTTTSRLLNAAVLVGALGYFVDIFDLLLFSILRIKSLQDLGVPPDQIKSVGVFLLNMQMGGMLAGGILWGILGDKKGRISVLFGSIFLYSVANIANAFVHDTSTYGVLRFLSGVGLAGEPGAAITLVSELMTQEKRGYGTAIVASIGVCGALFGATIGKTVDWRHCYMIGGALGLMLLVLRMSVAESKMFSTVRTNSGVSKGNFFALFTSRERFIRYLCCILIGTPIWYVIGILVTFSPELAKDLGVTGPVSSADAVFYSYLGFVFGDIGSGVLSQYLKSRRKAVAAFLVLTGAFVLLYLFSRGVSPSTFLFICFLLGCAAGYWAVFITIGAEQFGTNLRATVATTCPNFVRGMVLPITQAYVMLEVRIGNVHSALVVGMVCVLIGFLALLGLKETFGKDLDYAETFTN